jgi:hypothetical protein
MVPIRDTARQVINCVRTFVRGCVRVHDNSLAVTAILAAAANSQGLNEVSDPKVRVHRSAEDRTICQTGDLALEYLDIPL